MNYLDTIATTIQCLTDSDPNPADLALYRIYAVLCLGKGALTQDEDVHNAWAAWMSTAYPGHRSIVPFSELAPDVQALDTPYTDVIRCVAAAMRREGALESGPVLDQLPAMFPPPTADEIAAAERARQELAGEDG